MLTLAIKTIDQEAELYLLQGSELVDKELWQAGKQLSSTIFKKVENLLEEQKLELSDLQGIIYYEGPGSFTGLRISATVINTLADSYQIPIACVSGEDWLKAGVKMLSTGSELAGLAIPNYGQLPNITKPRK